MIKIKTKIDKENSFTFDYHCKESHTLEHAILIAKLWNMIYENERNMNDDDIHKLIKEILKEEREEI